jgi:hypothetical protein
MAKLKTPKHAVPKHQGSELSRSGLLQKDSQKEFSPLRKIKFLKGKKKLF